MSTTPPPVPPKPKCPECDTELVLVNGQIPEKCAKCDFQLDGWEPFLRWFKKAKELTEKKEEKKEEEVVKPARKKGVLSRLARR